MNLSIIVAIADNNAIGKDNSLLWHLPLDLKRFKEITTGHTLIMGRKTFESIGKPLPNRRSIVVTRNRDYTAKGATVVNSIKKALTLLGKDDPEVFIIGGGEIYKSTLKIANKLYITRVKKRFDADTFFPEVDWNEWKLIKEDELIQDKDNNLPATFQIFERKRL